MASRDEIIKYLFEAQQIGIDEVIKLLEGTKQKSEEAGNAFEFLKKHMAEIISVAAAVELAFKGIEFGKESLKNAEDVEASLSRVRALAGDAAAQFGEMDEAVEKAAQSVNVTSQTSAAGLAALVGAGLSAKGAIDALIPTLQLAKIANIDVGQAAQLVAQQLDAFNLPASDAQKVVDELTQASHGAAGGLGAMSAAAAQLAPDARALKLSFDDTVSILGLLSSKGLDAEKSVRGLRTIFQELQNPTSNLRGELLALGDGTDDFGKAITALNGNTPRAHEALLTLSGSSRTLVELLGQAGPDALAKFIAGLQNTQGVADRVAKALDDNLGGASKRFSLSIENIGEKLAKPVLAPFKDELEKLAGELNKFADSPDFKDIEKQVGEMAKNAATAIDKLIHGIDWKSFLADGKDALGTIGDKLKELADNAATIATAINKTFDVIGGATHAVVGGVQLVAGAVTGAVADVSELSDSVSAAARGMGDATDKSSGLTKALRSFSDEADSQATPNLEKLHDNLIDLTGAHEKATAATTAHGEAAKETAKKVAEFSDVVAGSATHAVADFGNVIAGSSTKFDGFGDALSLAHQHLAEASQAFADLQRAGNATPAAMTAAAQAVKQASDALEQLQAGGKPAADAVKTALHELGIVGQTSLKSLADAAQTNFETVRKASDGSASAVADTQNAFLAYAAKRLAASAQLDSGTRASVEADLDSQAAVLGISQALADLEKQSANSSAALTSDANRTAKSFDDEYEHLRKLREGFSGGGGDGPPPLDQGATKAKDAIGDMASDGGDSLAQLDNALANTRGAFVAISDAAAKAFDTRFQADFFTAFDDNGTGFLRVEKGMAQAAADTNAEIEAQRSHLKGLVDATNKVGTESVEDFNKLDAAAKYTNEHLQDTIDSIKAGTYNAGLLGKEELGPLLQALEAAKQRVDALKAAAQAATQQLADLGQQLQDERDQENGDLTAVENRRYQKQVKDIEDLAAKADAAGKAEAEKDLKLAAQIHAQKLKDIADEQAAQQKADNQSGSQGGGGSGAGAGGGRGGGSAGSSAGNGGGRGGSEGGASSDGGARTNPNTHAPLAPIHIHVNQQPVTTVYGNHESAQLLADILTAKGNSI